MLFLHMVLAAGEVQVVMEDLEVQLLVVMEDLEVHMLFLVYQ